MDLIGRNQWNSLQGNPNSLYFASRMKLNDYGYGGIQLITDVLGNQSTNIANLLMLIPLEYPKESS